MQFCKFVEPESITYMKQSLLIILTLMACIIAGAPESAARRGEKTVGLRTGYNTHNESALAGITFSYQFSNHVRIAPNADYMFRKNGTDAFSLNCNMHFPWQIGKLPINLYPLAGCNYTQWSMRHTDIATTDDSSTRINRFGINVGGGVEWYTTSTFKLSAECKFGWMKDFNTGVVSIGVAYVF